MIFERAAGKETDLIRGGRDRAMSGDREHISPDYRAILDLVKPGSTVLDLGCGNGDLLALLVREKKVKAQGIEIDDKAIFECVGQGAQRLSRRHRHRASRVRRPVLRFRHSEPEHPAGEKSRMRC